MARARANQILTAMEAKFVNAILKGLTRHKAALKAGYSKKSAKDKGATLKELCLSHTPHLREDDMP